MNPEEYLKLYPEETYAYGITKTNSVCKYGLMLEFTEESACQWGGSFPGNYASFCIYNGKERDLRTIREHQEMVFAIWKKNNLRKASKQKIEDVLIDSPTIEFPITLRGSGNDDCSYSKFFKTIEEAKEFLDFLEANQPLVFEEVIDFGFVFTN